MLHSLFKKSMEINRGKKRIRASVKHVSWYFMYKFPPGEGHCESDLECQGDLYCDSSSGPIFQLGVHKCAVSIQCSSKYIMWLYVLDWHTVHLFTKYCFIN